jgi:hypothetical protein
MNTWTPIFSKIVDSSIWAEPDYVCKVFITMLALKDADQVVRHNAYAIGKKCWPGDDEAEERAIKALKIMSSPDKRRIEKQPYEGRRIEKVEDGWLVLNGEVYEKLMRSINRRKYKTDKQREYREDAKGVEQAALNEAYQAARDSEMWATMPADAWRDQKLNWRRKWPLASLKVAVAQFRPNGNGDAGI